MLRRSEAQVIEIFHLLFLRALAAGRSDWFTLKGGTNLRYFFDSPRYSNDIDLDFAGRDGWQVTKAVAQLLSGQALTVLARSSGIELAEVSAPKQTDTTLRWKLGLSAPEHHDVIRTKIEFSGRGEESDEADFAVVPAAIVQPYGLQAPTVRHYLETTAIDQKIAALALRSETKARDIFDLDLLLRRRAAGDNSGGLDGTYAADAADRALLVPYANFMSEVAPFLDAEMADLYDASVWDAMCVAVADELDQVATAASDGGAT